jgi:DNA transformation protein and related proteins
MANPEFVAFVVEQMASLGEVRARRMFGGHGLYRGDLFFALIVDDRLFFKADEHTRADFVARHSLPFVYEKKGKSYATKYYEAPPEVFDDQDAMRFWALKAIAVATRAAAISAKPKSRSRRGSGRAGRSP